MSKPKHSTSDLVEILHRRYVAGQPDMEARLQQARLSAVVAQKVHDLRTQMGLTQRQLAERIGTTASAICRLEDADYEGHSLTMLQRIAAAVGHGVEINFVPAPSPSAGAARVSPADRVATARSARGRKGKATAGRSTGAPVKS